MRELVFLERLKAVTDIKKVDVVGDIYDLYLIGSPKKKIKRVDLGNGSESSITARFRKLKGKAKEAKWIEAKQNNEGPGLTDHFGKHGHEIGSKTTREYDLSARETIQNGREFKYNDRRSGKPRIGYYDEAKKLFTATSQTRNKPAILTHFKESWEELRKLPGFSVKN